MSKALNSPTARLLRSSRLFSLPPPLPTPSMEPVTSQGFIRASDTATMPYPTHQAISTPASSKHRGDWGLKRPLPSRSIPASTPHLRVRAIDNLNHITDFASAADHTQTIAKWQEMNVPMTHRQAQDSISGRPRQERTVSAFEEELDHTSLGHGLREMDMSAERATQLRSLNNPADEAAQRKRWKTSGPWVSGMSEGDFQHYLDTTVRKNKDGFLRFLEDVKMGQKRAQALGAMRDEGLLSDEDPRAIELDLLRASKLDEHELDDYIKDLRDNNGNALNLSTELLGLVRDYFDLPSFPAPRKVDDNKMAAEFDKYTVRNDSGGGPPATHLSAGLSYIRTAAYMENHPVYGPQAKRAPVQARVLQTNGAQARDQAAKLGVAGVVVVDTNKSNFNVKNIDQPLTADQAYALATKTFDTEIVGGNKVWVHPSRAHIDENGHIRLAVERGTEQAIGVKTGNPVEMPTLDSTRASARMPFMDSRSSTQTPRANYGIGLPNYRIPRAKGFDDEISKVAETKGDGKNAAAHLEALLEEHTKVRK